METKLNLHPNQQIVWENDVIRFRKNKIVCALLDTGKLDLNDIGALPFPQEDRIQFAQLIGYSVSGFGDLPYVPSSVIEVCDKEAEILINDRRRPQTP